MPSPPKLACTRALLCLPAGHILSMGGDPYAGLPEDDVSDEEDEEGEDDDEHEDMFDSDEEAEWEDAA